MIEETELTRRLAGQPVDTYAFPDGRYEVQWKGVPLTCTVFDKDQEVSRAAITEREELGAVLAHIQELQAAVPPKPARPGAGLQAGHPAPAHRPPQRRLELQARHPREGQAGCRDRRPHGRASPRSVSTHPAAQDIPTLRAPRPFYLVTTGILWSQGQISSDIRNWPGLLPHLRMLPSAAASGGARAAAS